MNVRILLQRLLRETGGATAIEYALLGSLIAVVIVLAVESLGVELRGLFEFVANQVRDAVS